MTEVADKKIGNVKMFYWYKEQQRWAECEQSPTDSLRIVVAFMRVHSADGVKFVDLDNGNAQVLC